MIAAISGTTVSGAFDPLDKIGAIARAANAWFHVDACWGGAVAFSDKLKHMLRGSELADSIAFNPHKMPGVPLLCAFLLARDLRTFWVANKLKAGYLFHENHANTKAEKIQPLDQKHDSKDWRNSAQLEDAPNVSEIRDLASLTVQCCR
ncbi:hypothetical protein PFICI_09217 [Pestalotiopsis fici W106-1]|uniref:Glutamate decarboxylase n=1 Tax=Pestalotiopsis fici (strain W106-1 / CGMCC3.15140) TaxID=1229662 RepID=W3X021_PESFW|nr:uncharacterized protein PFICI_09217 [Pestalotiopsis fici W106-1]ETS79364.1 hypothetical protein PFICI_09217 [Pestalotiopsis fici W106-1]